MRMARPISMCVMFVASTSPAWCDGPDALDEALALANLRRADLGWTPKGWWSRYPADIPYKNRAFDSLFAEPLDTVTFTRSLGEAVKIELDAATIDVRLDRGTTHLYSALHRLGINPKFGGLRGYTSNLTAEPTALDEALLKVHEAAGRPTRAFTFYQDLPYPQYAADLKIKLEAIPESVRPILGQLVMNVIDAHRWADLAFRNVNAERRLAISRRLMLGAEEVDAFDFSPDIDDAARTWDEASLWYGGEKCLQALDDARIVLKQLDAEPGPFVFDWETPWGWIRIRGTGDDEIDGVDSLLVVDLGGNDSYSGSVGATVNDRRVSLALDCGGNDRYRAGGPAQGAGVCGIGILIDGGGNDQYEAASYGQGAGQFGLGVLADVSGDDTYFTQYSGQGCGFFGVGLLMDVSGTDSYRLYSDGQGFGGIGGVGVLADRNGSDRYEAVRDCKITNRRSYHSTEHDVTVSNAQGCAMGRRGDGADGHSYAGGLGALLDAEGDDEYVSGNWSMGTGYWFGIGLLHDGAGDDTYRGAVWSQATGAHFCIGALVDEAGNDRHLAEATANMCIAWGHDFTIALLLDIGGDDEYDVNGGGLGQSINRSVAALVDMGGNDRYKGKGELPPGSARFDERFRARGEVSDYFADTTSLGLFLDIGGTDQYSSYAAAQGAFVGANNDTWTDEADSDNVRARNFSIGVDREEGTASWRPQPVKSPGGE